MGENLIIIWRHLGVVFESESLRGCFVHHEIIQMRPKQKSVRKIKKNKMNELFLRYWKEKDTGDNKQSNRNKNFENKEICSCILPYIEKVCVFI